MLVIIILIIFVFIFFDSLMDTHKYYLSTITLQLYDEQIMKTNLLVFYSPAIKAYYTIRHLDK